MMQDERRDEHDAPRIACEVALAGKSDGSKSQPRSGGIQIAHDVSRGW